MLRRDKGYNHILAGGSAALLRTIIGQPFDVIATNMIGKYKGDHLLRVCRNIYRSEGLFSGFWKGTFPAIYRLIPHAATYYYFLHFFRTNARKSVSISHLNQHFLNFLIGASARSIAVFVTNPLLIVKTHFEYNMSHDKRIMKTLTRIYETGGVRGLFRGLNSSIIRNSPFGGLFFSVYLYLLPRMKFRQRSVNVFVSSVIANMFAHYLLHPFGVIRTRIQLQEKSVGMFQGLWSVYSEEGLFQLWRGTIPRMTKKAVASSLAWTLYQFMFIKSEKS